MRRSLGNERHYAHEKHPQSGSRLEDIWSHYCRGQQHWKLRLSAYRGYALSTASLSCLKSGNPGLLSPSVLDRVQIRIPRLPSGFTVSTRRRSSGVQPDRILRPLSQSLGIEEDGLGPDQASGGQIRERIRSPPNTFASATRPLRTTKTRSAPCRRVASVYRFHA